ncbi:MAG TPA: glycosyltransferase [Vicinamibacterales bacterium]|nr:glycosyltransferase [Vicinamibacterales bacterium]
MSTEPLRILELRSVRGTGGGPEKTILLGAQRAARRFPVTVCYIRDARDHTSGIAERASRLGIDYVEIVEHGSFDRAIWPALRTLVRDRGIDLVHAHDYKTDLLALLLARVEGTIPLATAHGWTGHSLKERLLYYALDKRLLRAFPRTIAVSSEIKAELLRHHARADRIRTVLNGIDHRAFRRDRSSEPAVRRELGVAPDDIVIGSVGRLEPQKRFDLLIHACGRLQREWPRLRLVIAGDGSERASLTARAADLLAPGTWQFCGHTGDIARLHHGLDVFVQSSDYEGTSNAVLEAMALETPIVATAAGGTAEMIEHGMHGLVVPCGDPIPLAAAISQTLLDSQATAKRVAEARRRVETTLSFDERVATVERIYADLAGMFPRPARPPLAERCA